MSEDTNNEPVEERVTLKDENATLREEMLQLLREQSNLTYVSTLSFVAILIGAFQQISYLTQAVLLLELLLIGIALKVNANYKRLYLNDVYLRVVHENKCKKIRLSKQNPSQPMLHWLSFKRVKSLAEKKGSSVDVDAKFFRILGGSAIVSSFLFALRTPSEFGIITNYNEKCVDSASVGDWIPLVLLFTSYLLLWCFTIPLRKTLERSKRFEKEFWRVLIKEKAKSSSSCDSVDASEQEDPGKS